MSIDEAGDDEVIACVDHLRARDALRRQPLADGSDLAALDQDVGFRRLVNIAVVVIDEPAFDEELGRSHISLHDCARRLGQAKRDPTFSVMPWIVGSRFA